MHHFGLLAITATLVIGTTASVFAKPSPEVMMSAEQVCFASGRKPTLTFRYTDRDGNYTAPWLYQVQCRHRSGQEFLYEIDGRPEEFFDIEALYRFIEEFLKK